MVKVTDITLETEWEDMVRAKISEIGLHPGWFYNNYTESEVKKDFPVYDYTGESWLHKRYRVAEIAGDMSEQRISVYGEEFLSRMVLLGTWMENTFNRPATVVLKSKQKQRYETGIVKWLQDNFGPTS